MNGRTVRQGWVWRWLFVCAALPMACAGTVAAQDSGRDYPQWRGVNRDGAASAFTEPTTWPEALTRRWKVDVGEGYATPLVIKNTVYAFTRQGGHEVMTALDAATGQELWHTSYPAPYAPATLAAAHVVGPKATPLFRMALVDRVILRLAVFELLAAPATPRPVVINEAIELAKTFSTDAAVKFVNEILDGVARRVAGGPPDDVPAPRPETP